MRMQIEGSEDYPRFTLGSKSSILAAENQKMTDGLSFNSRHDPMGRIA